VVLIFDCCHAGSMPVKDENLDPNLKVRRIENSDGDDNYEGLFDGLSKTGRVILASCKKNEKAGIFSDNGIFTYYFVEGLEGSADINQDNWVSAEEAFEYAKPRTTLEWSRQHPQMYDGVPGQVKLTEISISSHLVLNNFLSRLLENHPLLLRLLSVAERIIG
jgi:uncharacterized caspase-like protein